MLFEIAADQLGFTIDEPRQPWAMGLKLTAFLEPRRSELEAVLPSLELAA